VVGQSNQEIWTDEYGRVKVQFHWDRHGAFDENSSCWVRVAQLWAGSGFGGIHIPRISQEVIVDFLEGDPDRPIITGRIYNADNMPPYALPQNQTQSGIKSRSTKDASTSNFNEIRFEDKKGEEELFVQAEKNHTINVKNNQSTTVGASRSASVGGSDSVSVTGDRSLSVHGNLTVTVDGTGKGATQSSMSVTGKHNMHASDTIDMDAPTHVKLVCGGSSITIEPGKITISAGGGAAVVLDANLKAVSSAGSNLALDANAKTESSGGAKTLLDANVLAESSGGAKVVLDANVLNESSGGAQVVLDTNALLKGVQATVQGDASAELDSSGNVKADPSGVTIMGTMVKLN
jgi:type VI secretion system secreted protein VgrG